MSGFPSPTSPWRCTARPTAPVGEVYYRPGPMLASSTSVNVTIRGKGGHGACPHRTVDPIVLAALAILDFQTIVSREVEPIHPAVLTVGSIHGGQKHNIISDEVKLQLTLRAYSEAVRLQLIEGIERRVDGLARAHKAPAPSVEVQEYTPATINSPDLVARVVPVLKKELGDAQVKLVDPVMGAEDFAPLRGRRRADHDVLDRHHRHQADRGGEGQGGRPAGPPLGALPPRSQGERRRRRPRHDRRRIGPAAAAAREVSRTRATATRP